MSAPQAAAITACTACAAVGGAAAGGAFSSSTNLNEEHDHETNESASNTETSPKTNVPKEETQTPWFPVADEKTENKSEITDNKIGKVYEKYLVGAFGDTGKDNNPWWVKSYEKYKKDKETTESPRTFSANFGDNKVSDAFKNKEEADKVTNDPKPLNKICFELYKQEKSTVYPTSGDATKTNLWNDLWRYCSDLGETPKTIEEASETTHYSSTNKIGNSKKTVLLATKGTHNNKLWDLKNKEFKAISADISGEYFKKVQERIKATSSPTTLKEECEKAYALENKTQETATEVKDENVVKYCSLTGSEN